MDGRGHYSLLILVAVFLTYFIENFLRSAPSALSPILIEELGLTYGAAGILISSCLFLYAFMQLPSGILSDALGPRRTIVGFTAFTILGALLFFLARRCSAPDRLWLQRLPHKRRKGHLQVVSSGQAC